MINSHDLALYLLISFSNILLSILAYYSNILMFYQVVLIELVFFGVVIALPRLLLELYDTKKIF